jgi:hypothetical protein
MKKIVVNERVWEAIAGVVFIGYPVSGAQGQYSGIKGAKNNAIGDGHGSGVCL